MIVVDTSLLVYAVGAEHPLREPSRRFIEALRAGTVTAATTVSVIQAFVNVRARRRPRSDAVGLGRDFARLLSPLVPVDERDLDVGLRLFEQHRRLGTFDAVLAAVAINRDAEALVSSERGFRNVPRLRHVDLGDRDLETLIAP